MCHLFVFSDVFSARIAMPLLFCNCFRIKLFHLFFWKVYHLHVLPGVQNKNYTSDIYQLLPDIYCKKFEYEFCKYYILLLLFSEVVLLGVSKNNPINKQIDAKIQVMHQFENLQRRKRCRDYRNKLQKQITNCNCLHPNVFFVMFSVRIIFFYYYSDPKILSVPSNKDNFYTAEIYILRVSHRNPPIKCEIELTKNMFRVNNRDSKTTSVDIILASLFLTFNISNAFLESFFSHGL